MSNSLSIVERIASWSSALVLDAVPDDVRKAANRCIIDLIGVAIAGASCRQSQRVFDYARQAYAAGTATTFDFSSSLSPVGAALANANAGHALDFDDTSYTGIMHGSTVVLPAALAAAESVEADGCRLLEAFIAGSEIAYGIAVLCTDSHYHKGWWSTATFGVFGAAAAAARAMQLSKSQTTAAIALAGVQANGLKVAFGTDAKPYLAGRAAAIGVEAAILASSGHSGPPTVMEDGRGFIQVLNDGVFNNDGIDKLGIDWRLVSPGIFFKQYPVCSAAHAAVELTQLLLQENELQSQDIDKVVCSVPPLVAASLVYDRPGTAQEAQFSMPFAVGTMLARGKLAIENLTDEALSDSRIQAEMSKVDMCRVDSLEEAEAPECARVTLITSDGRELTGFLGAPTGMPANPISDELLHEKFLHCTSFAGLQRKQSTALLQRLIKIESMKSGVFNKGNDTNE